MFGRAWEVSARPAMRSSLLEHNRRWIPGGPGWRLEVREVGQACLGPAGMFGAVERAIRRQQEVVRGKLPLMLIAPRARRCRCGRCGRKRDVVAMPADADAHRDVTAGRRGLVSDPAGRDRPKNILRHGFAAGPGGVRQQNHLTDSCLTGIPRPAGSRYREKAIPSDSARGSAITWPPA